MPKVTLQSLAMPMLGLGLLVLPTSACDPADPQDPRRADGEELGEDEELSAEELEDEALEDEALEDEERGEGPARAKVDRAGASEDEDDEPELTIEDPSDPEAVVYGNPVATCEWPATVSMMGNCTGSLVHPELVIYAAHCGTGYSQVWLGENTSTARARTISTAGCHLFPGGGPGGGDDFAYCRLATPIDDVPIVPPLMGCETDILQPGQPVTLVGYGYDEFGSIGTKREAVTTINSITAANEAFIGGAPGGGLPDTCQGDSGGPVYVELADGSWRVFGITSYGGACGTGGYYSMMHIGMQWFESHSGIDLTPCHDADGTWNPGPECGDFPMDPNVGFGSWGGGCSGGPESGPSSTCGPAGGGSGECCAAHGSPGCEIAEVEACVCGADPYCCNTAWDSICASEVESLGCSTCVEPESGCCEAGGGPGCGEDTVEACVCAADPYCCNTAWDSLCASEVESLGCGVCPPPPPPPHSCCETGAAGCENAIIESGVCGADPYCCSTAWDSICVAEVESLGFGLCESTCCAAQATPGCDDAGVQACVCGADPYCCSTAWDSICASEVEGLGCSQCG